MPLTFVSGDPTLTSAHILMFGANAAGRPEMGALELLLFNRYPAAFATYAKYCRSGRAKTGTLWLWRETIPALGFMIVRETPVGATRTRYVEAALMTLARDYKRDNIRSVAIAPLTSAAEWQMMKPILRQWLGRSSLPVMVYEAYVSGAKADETFTEELSP